MPCASIKCASDYLIAAFQRYRRQHRARHVRLAIKFFAIALLLPVAVWNYLQAKYSDAALGAALSVVVFFAHHVDYWLVRRSLKQSPYRDEDVLIEFNDAGFHARSPKQDTQLQWAAFTMVAHFRDGFLLFQGPRVFNWIPISSLGSASQAAELSALLRSKISDHRIIEPSATANGGPATPPAESGVTTGPPSLS